MSDREAIRAPTIRSLPRTVWALGFVSLFMDISSEMIHSLLPLFLVSTLHASTVVVGLIEGLGEGMALLMRTFSGFLSDRLGKRKVLAVAGYGIGALSKPLFALAPGVGVVLGARLLDRVGKGIRGAPRDALVADVTPEAVRGAAYGLRQSLDTIGAFGGPLLAAGLMVWTAGAIRIVFWVAVVPAVLAVVILVLTVREPRRQQADTSRPPLRWRQALDLGRPFWLVVAAGLLFTMARFSEAFLLLRGSSVGLPMQWIPLLMVVMNVVYAATSYPAGRLSDRLGRHGLLAFGLLILIGADVVLALASSAWHVAAGTALWGLHMGLSQGLLTALVADVATPDLRGTAFGVFNLVSGVGVLVASVLAGLLWEGYGAPTAFWTGAGLAAAALVGFTMLRSTEERDR